MRYQTHELIFDYVTLNSQGHYPLFIEAIISIPANPHLQLTNLTNMLYNEDSASFPKEDAYEYSTSYI